MYYELDLIDYLLLIPTMIAAWCVAIMLITYVISGIIDYFRNDEEEEE